MWKQTYDLSYSSWSQMTKSPFRIIWGKIIDIIIPIVYMKIIMVNSLMFYLLFKTYDNSFKIYLKLAGCTYAPHHYIVCIQ